jgi:small subunit ribosomal protein S16
MLKLRLQRPSSNTNTSTYHIVAADSTFPRDGKFFDKIGTIYTKYPYEKNSEFIKNYTLVRIDKQKLTLWLNRGAQPTKKLKRILKYI